MIRTILSLCSRDIGHEVMYSRLDQAIDAFHTQNGSWDALIQEAEKQGVAPLLYKHLGEIDCAIAKDSQRLLQSLYLRNRRSNTIRNQAIVEILDCFQLEKIESLLVKGIALCNFAYSEPGLRPMRDIDLLIKKGDLPKAEKMLFNLGYRPDQDHDIPDDYYHLVPMGKSIDGLPISIEVHHNLLPFHPQYPLWPLEKSYNTALQLEINNIKARTLCLEDTLYYTYLHGFMAPLTYEPFRFMHVADMVTLVEKYIDTLDWQVVRDETPTLCNVISRFHYLTPWPENVSRKLSLDIGDKPHGIGLPYSGWPLRKFRTIKITETAQLTKETLWPSRWWMQIYYGHLRGIGYVKARLFDHPRMIWRWIKAYCHSYFSK